MAKRVVQAGVPDLMRLATAGCRSALAGAFLASALVNVLYLTGSFFMLEVYDRVLPSQSVPTLIGLGLLALMLYGFQALFDTVRSRLLARAGTSLAQQLSEPAFKACISLPQKIGNAAEANNPVRKLDQVRTFLSGSGPSAFFDLPWMPFYIAICFIIHPAIGYTALAGALIICCLGLLPSLVTRNIGETARDLASERQLLSEATRRNAEVVATMGLASTLYADWNSKNDSFTAKTQKMSDITSGLSIASKVLRLILQSTVLGVGAYLVIMQQASAGVIIASSIISSRAIAPVELVVGHWHSFVAARQAWNELGTTFKLVPLEAERLTLPEPSSSLVVDQLFVVPPGADRPSVSDVGFTLQAGSGLGIIGASASGKSSLVRALAGVWHPRSGAVRLDGAALVDWKAEQLGTCIGYLPQSVELFAGSVAQNICRFSPGDNSAAIVQASKAAGVHEMILELPNGYETQIGTSGSVLSAGQRQRVALARALYGDPFLVVLDEPNSNLDLEGEAALTQAIMGVRRRGGVVVVAAHRPSALAGVNFVLTMHQGRIQSFGPRDEILSKLLRPTQKSEENFPQASRA